MTQHTLAFIGIGRMGGNLALQAIEKGFKVLGYSRRGPSPAQTQAGMVPIKPLSALRLALPRPRMVFLYVPAGKAVDLILDQLAQILEPGDIILDGGNSYWGDSIARHRRMKDAGIDFIDLGTSGGESGARNGACFMAGGEDGPIQQTKDILEKLCVPQGYVHAGGPGTGHFTKLVHNGIEFGMLQAIGEGMNLIEDCPIGPLPVQDILKCWAHGSVIRSWLIDLMEKGYREQGGLRNVSPYVEDTGEVNWLVSDALKMEVPIPVITQAVMQLFASRDSAKEWAKAIAVMRHGFGGHPFGPSKAITEERKTGRSA